MPKSLSPKPDAIAYRICLARGRRVMLDADVAALYGVPTRRLNEAVKRNQERFPEDFMFRLTPEEQKSLRSHDATSSAESQRYLPYAFSKQCRIGFDLSERK